MMLSPARLTTTTACVREGDAAIRIGGPAGAFVPELELRRWDSQCVRVRLLHDEPGIVSQDQQALVWTTPSIEARWYRLPDQRFEFATIFYGAVPACVRFAYETSAEIETTRQAPLAHLRADGSTWEDNGRGGIRSRPADVGNSFACYVPWSGDYSRCGGWNYQSGKVAHLFRPWIVDAVGHFAWCEVALVQGVLTIRIPAAFRDTAISPCLLDPTFGYSGTAASDDNTGGARLTFKAVTAPGSNGTLDSITFKGRIRTDNGAIHPNHAPAIYSDSAGVPSTLLEGINTIGSLFGVSDAEVTTAMAGTTALTSGTTYWPSTRQGGAIPDYGTGGAGCDCWIKYDAAGGTDNFFFLVTNNNANWPASVSGWTNVSNERAYAYGSFTASGGGAGFLARSPVNVGQAMKRASYF